MPVTTLDKSLPSWPLLSLVEVHLVAFYIDKQQTNKIKYPSVFSVDKVSLRGFPRKSILMRTLAPQANVIKYTRVQ